MEEFIKSMEQIYKLLEEQKQSFEEQKQLRQQIAQSNAQITSELHQIRKEWNELYECWKSQADSTDDDTDEDEDEDLTVFNDSAGEAYSQDDNAVVEYDPVPADARSTSKLGNNNTSTPMNFTTKLEFPTFEVSTKIAPEMFEESPKIEKLKVEADELGKADAGSQHQMQLLSIPQKIILENSRIGTLQLVSFQPVNVQEKYKEFIEPMVYLLNSDTLLEIAQFDSNHDWGGDYPVVVTKEPVRKWPPDHFSILDVCYAEPQRYAYTSQNYIFVTRLMQEKESSVGIKPLRLMERSVFSDRMVFVRAVREAKWMNKMGVSIYNSWFGPVVSSLLGNDEIIGAMVVDVSGLGVVLLGKFELSPATQITMCFDIDAMEAKNSLVSRLSELLGVEVKMTNGCIGEEVKKLVFEIPVNVMRRQSLQDGVAAGFYDNKIETVLIFDPGGIQKSVVVVWHLQRGLSKKREPFIHAKNSFENYAYNLKIEAPNVREMKVLVFDPGGAGSSIIC